MIVPRFGHRTPALPPQTASKPAAQTPGNSSSTVALSTPEPSASFAHSPNSQDELIKVLKAGPLASFVRRPNPAQTDSPLVSAPDADNDIEAAWADLRRMAGKLIPKRVQFQEPTEEIPLGWWQTLQINREAFSNLKLSRTEVNRQMSFLQKDAEKYLDSGPAKQEIDSVTKSFLGPTGQKEQKIVQGNLTRLLNGTGKKRTPKEIAKDVQELVVLRHQMLPELRDSLEEAWQDWEVQENDLLNMDIVQAQQALDDYGQALEQLLP